jgi:hypothetical protein
LTPEATKVYLAIFLCILNSTTNHPPFTRSSSLGLAAGIDGLTQLAGSVFHSLIKYAQPANSAKGMANKLATELRNLSGLLLNLSLLTGQLEDSGMTPMVAFQESQFALWKDTISKIEKKVDQGSKDFQGSSFENKMRSLKWPFSRDETDALLAELNRHKVTIHLALAVENFSKLFECLGL